MLLSSLFAVIIGLLFLWMVLSLATIQIQEWVITRLDTRAKGMENAIEQMLANPNLKAQFYDHPIIRSLTATTRNSPNQESPWLYRYPIVRGFAKKKRHLPSYIPSTQFALAMFDIIMTANTESSIIQQGILRIRDDLRNSRQLTVSRELIDQLDLLAEFARSAAATEAGTAITNRTLATLKDNVEHFTENFETRYPNIPLDSAVVKEIQDVLASALNQAPRLKTAMDSVVDQQPLVDPNESALGKVRSGIAALSVISPELSQTLTALIFNIELETRSGEQRVDLAIRNVEKWFDDTLDRASGAFKRYSQTLAFTIGIYLAVFLNLDVISISEYLWREPVIRQALIQNASNFTVVQTETVITPQQVIQDLRTQFTGISLPPIGWDGFETASDKAVKDPSCQLFPKDGQAFGIPVIFTKTCIAPPQSSAETNLLLKLFGILITSLAARFGAPFWFDVMKRLTNLRLARPT